MKKRYSISVSRSLAKVGADIRDARRRRRLQMRTVAERAAISRVTLSKIEKGDPGVAFGSYAAVLQALGMLERLTTIADAVHDEVGLRFEEERLPQRVRYKRNGESSRQ